MRDYILNLNIAAPGQKYAPNFIPPDDDDFDTDGDNDEHCPYANVDELPYM